MATHTRPTFVDGHVVKDLLEDKSKVPGKDYLVIDVRDSDYIVSHSLLFFFLPWCSFQKLSDNRGEGQNHINTQDHHLPHFFSRLSTNNYFITILQKHEKKI